MGGSLPLAWSDEQREPPTPQAEGDDEESGLLPGEEVDDENVRVAATVAAAKLNTQPPPALRPRIEAQADTPLTAAAREQSLFVTRETEQALARSRGIAADTVAGSEARGRASTDVANLLGKSPEAVGVGVQRRTPIVNDPRLRGSRVGQLAASGSHWIPARIDLDTVLSKIDSRIIEQVTVVKGPYSAFYGPNLRFIDFDLLDSPRFEEGREIHGSTGLEYKSNGDQWYGRQTVWGGDEDWGYRIGYGDRSGNDYRAGNNERIAASYHSREFDVSVGRDLSPDSTVEFHYLRLDQTDVEYPGQAFDMDYLVSDGYELEYETRETALFETVNFEAWYNRTRFAGNAQSRAKRQQFPFLDTINYEGFTDVDAMSTGYSAAGTWGSEDDLRLTIGTDLRHVKQELNELSSGGINFNIFDDANSPIPRSFQANPGVFAEAGAQVTDRLTAKLGGRVDYVQADVIEDPAQLEALGIGQPQSSLADILGTDEFQQDFMLWSIYLTTAYEINPCWTFETGVGHGQRPPSLTELYVAESFLFLLQNGQNNATGDPQLSPERLTQLDLTLRFDGDYCRGYVNGFYGWINDYITFENAGVFTAPPFGQVEQVNLRYVNTDLATLTGFDAYLEYDANDWLTPFGTLSYIEGTDRTRNGDFATFAASGGDPSVKVPGRPRGFFSQVPGDAVEPLPQIVPLESRVGLRLHEVGAAPRYGVEFSARMVAAQTRVAKSLLESPTAGFTVFDARGFWNITERAVLIAGVENFTDRSYREHLDFRSPSGRSVLQPGVNVYSGFEIAY